MASLKGRRTDEDRAFDDQLGETIRRHRVGQGLSQSELAKRSGVTFQQIQKYELGVNRIAASRLAAVSRALGVPMAVLLGEREPDPVAFRPDLARLADAYDRCSPLRRSVIGELALLFAADAG